MSLGILTEKGIYMTSAPVLTDNESSLFFFKKSKTNMRIKELQAKLKKLKELDLLKGRKGAKASTEKEHILTDVIT